MVSCLYTTFSTCICLHVSTLEHECLSQPKIPNMSQRSAKRMLGTLTLSEQKSVALCRTKL